MSTKIQEGKLLPKVFMENLDMSNVGKNGWFESAPRCQNKVLTDSKN